MKKNILSQLLVIGLLTISMTTISAQSIQANEANDIDLEISTEDEKNDDKIASKDEHKDILTIKGLTRYDIRRDNVEGKKGETKKSLLRMRLEPTLNLGDDWKIKNRVDVDINYKDRDEDHFYNRMLYLQGPAFGGTISLGKIDYADFANMEIGYGMIYDDYLKGGKFTYKDAKSDIVYTTAVGNFDSPHNDKNNGMLKNYPEYDAMHYVGLQAEIPMSDKLMTGVAYHNVRSGELEEIQQILEIANEYKFDNNFKLGAIYAMSNLDSSDYGLKDNNQEKAYVMQLNYKGIKRSEPNTFGTWVAYKNLGQLSTFVPTYTNSFVGEKGFELGTKYVFAKNLTGEISYFNGKNIDNNKEKTRWFGRVEYRF